MKASEETIERVESALRERLAKGEIGVKVLDESNGQYKLQVAVYDDAGKMMWAMKSSYQLTRTEFRCRYFPELLR